MRQNKWCSELPRKCNYSYFQGTVLKPLTCVLRLLLFFLLALVHNIADDTSDVTIITSSEPGCEVAVNCFNKNKMIINPGKFHNYR